MGEKISQYPEPWTISPSLRAAPRFVTNVPRPCWRETNPARSSSARACCTVLRERPKRRISARSLGNGASMPYFPSRMPRFSASTSVRYLGSVMPTGSP